MKNTTNLLFIFIAASMLALSFSQAKASGPNATITNVSYPRCNADTGSAYAVAGGGTAPYTYLWSPNGGTNPKGTGLTAGSYTVTVTDNLGQTATASVTITQPPILIAVITAANNNTSCTKPDGSSSVMASGGLPPYTYLWMPGGNTNATATGLAAYTYTVTVADANCCTATASVTIGGSTAPILTLSSTADTNSCDGTVTAGVTGGVSPFTYKWSPGGYATSTVRNLCAGTYCCLVTDHTGCKDSTCVQVDNTTHHNCCLCVRLSTGIEPLNLKSSNVEIYPNPSKGIFTIQLSIVSGQPALSADRSSVEVYNMLGEKVLTETLRSTQGDNLIDLSNHPNGIYLYRVLSGDGSLLGEGKLVVQK